MKQAFYKLPKIFSQFTNCLTSQIDANIYIVRNTYIYLYFIYLFSLIFLAELYSGYPDVAAQGSFRAIYLYIYINIYLFTFTSSKIPEPMYNIYMCIYIYIYICLYIYIYSCIYLYIHIYKHIYDLDNSKFLSHLVH